MLPLWIAVGCVCLSLAALLRAYTLSRACRGVRALFQCGAVTGCCDGKLLPKIDFKWLRNEIIGVDSSICTPFGKRCLLYCDYTASGRSLHFVESYVQGLLQTYANTHTEDDVTGRSTGRILHMAEAAIKKCVNAGPRGKIIAVGTGATGAVYKLQMLLGIACPPPTKEFLLSQVKSSLGAEQAAKLDASIQAAQPVVFVGPFEHHSNEVSWRMGFATVVEIAMSKDGGMDLDDLKAKLTDPRYRGRRRIGSFSAASNVTGIRNDVREIARLLHAHDALACFDFAAAGPYVDIDMNPSADEWIDAIFLSPHKFLGGPGSSGILVIDQRLYRTDLPPSISGGGTVSYVSPFDQDFLPDIEEREKAGTPGILQTMRAALSFEIKNAIGVAAIEEREQQHMARAFAAWLKPDSGIRVLGNPDPHRRVAIVSFLVMDTRHPPEAGITLHPKFATALLNDLFGIQSRAGCSCAGPYGHHLLGIGREKSEEYRDWVRKGFQGIKPGWCRLGFHYVLDEIDVDFIIQAVLFVARLGWAFLPAYTFDDVSGLWSHKQGVPCPGSFSLGAAVNFHAPAHSGLSKAARRSVYASYLAEAERLAANPCTSSTAGSCCAKFGNLQFFKTS